MVNGEWWTPKPRDEVDESRGSPRLVNLVSGASSPLTTKPLTAKPVYFWGSIASALDRCFATWSTDTAVWMENRFCRATATEQNHLGLQLYHQRGATWRDSNID